LIEVARGLGKLLATGWTPRRTIYLLSWSGEEYGLLGSTGWAELNPHRLKRAVAYLNVDTVVSGDILSASATPALASVWKHVLKDLHESKEHAMSFANGPLGEIRDGNTNWILNQPELGILGSGSDYTVFLDHLGIASIDFSFEKEKMYGQYHSIYDSFAWMDAFGGTDGEKGSAFELMAFSAKIWGLLALRLADSALLPFNHIVQGRALLLYTETIEKQQCCELDLVALKDAVARYQEAARTLHLVCANNLLDEATCNEKIGLTERQFLAEEGLPKRPWFKHVLQAPGMYLGYAAEAFPGIQQAIDADDWDLARKQVVVVTERVQAAASFLRVHEDSGVADQQ
jgi:N-acetylated-alpha-linked acidic dipeptidase